MHFNNYISIQRLVNKRYRPTQELVRCKNKNRIIGYTLRTVVYIVSSKNTCGCNVKTIYC